MSTEKTVQELVPGDVIDSLWYGFQRVIEPPTSLDGDQYVVVVRDEDDGELDRVYAVADELFVMREK